MKNMIKLIGLGLLAACSVIAASKFHFRASETTRHEWEKALMETSEPILITDSIINYQQ